MCILFVREYFKLFYDKRLADITALLVAHTLCPVHHLQENDRNDTHEGWRKMMASVDPHPALKASSEQATLDSLTEDLPVTGKVTAHLFASTSGTDADWVVKLIDVYPAFDPDNMEMSQYQFPVTMKVFRGRFMNSFEKPQPLVPNKPEEFLIGLHQVNHTFKK